MTILVTDPTVPLIAGLISVREIDTWGVRGDQVPSGNGTPSLIWPSIDLPGDAAVEFRFEVLAHTFPAGIFFAYDDGSFNISPACPDGVYTVTGRIWADQIAQSPLVTHTFVMGSSGVVSLNAAMDPFLSALDLVVPVAPQITITGGMDSFAAGVNLSTTPTMTLIASMDSFVGVLSLRGGFPGTLPDTLSTDRQYTVLPDLHLDAYTIEHEHVLLWQKDPDSTLDYSINWADSLPADDVITNLYVSASSGIAVPAQGIVGAVTACMISGGGAAGSMQWCTMQIKTAQGRTDERTIKLLIRQQ